MCCCWWKRGIHLLHKLLIDVIDSVPGAVQVIPRDVGGQCAAATRFAGKFRLRTQASKPWQEGNRRESEREREGEMVSVRESWLGTKREHLPCALGIVNDHCCYCYSIASLSLYHTLSALQNNVRPSVLRTVHTTLEHCQPMPAASSLAGMQEFLTTLTPHGYHLLDVYLSVHLTLGVLYSIYPLGSPWTLIPPVQQPSQ